MKAAKPPVWVRQGNRATWRHYEIIREGYNHNWTIRCNGEKIGQAPLLYLAKLDAETHAKNTIIDKKTRQRRRVVISEKADE